MYRDSFTYNHPHTWKADTHKYIPFKAISVNLGLQCRKQAVYLNEKDEVIAENRSSLDINM
jgi:hypothetical protein